MKRSFLSLVLSNGMAAEWLTTIVLASRSTGMHCLNTEAGTRSRGQDLILCGKDSENISPFPSSPTFISVHVPVWKCGLQILKNMVDM